MADFLIDSGALVDCRDSLGRTPLFVTAQVILSKILFAFLIITSIANFVQKYQFDKKNMVSLLIGRGADADKVNVDGETPLCAAALVFLVLKRFFFLIFCENFLLIRFFYRQIQKGHDDVARILLCAGANPDIIASSEFGTAREVAERNKHVEIVLAIDQHKCRNLLVELCVGLYAADFPVLVVLEIHEALCASAGLHEAKLGEEKEPASSGLRQGRQTRNQGSKIKKKHHINNVGYV